MASFGRRLVLVISCLLFSMLSSISLWNLTRSPSKLATIFVVTPTFHRPTQLADLTRLCNTLLNVHSLFWIIVEDADVIREDVSMKEQWR